MPLTTERVPVARLSSFYLFYYAALGAFTPYWSLYLESQGLGITAISVMMSLWYATRVVAPSIWTGAAAVSSRPIRWLQAGCLLTLLTFCAFLLPLPGYWPFVAMAAFCFFYNAVMPQFESITLTHLGADSHRYGMIRVWGSFGFIAVVSGFGWLIEHYGAAHLPWLMLPLFGLLLASAMGNRYARNLDGPGNNTDKAGFWAIVRRPAVLAFFIAAFLEQLSFGPYYTFFSVYMSNHGYATGMLGLMWTVGVIFEVLVFFAISHIFRRFDASWLLIISMASASLRWVATALWPENLPVMLVAQATHCLGFAAFFASAMQLLAGYFPGRLNGHGQGLFYGFSSGLGGVLGALIAGQLWRFGDGQVAFLAGAGFAFIGTVIAFIWVRPRRAA